ncbi:MAG TPA: hypothetical protein QGI30_02515, partial [Anaerolineales bacterium]|nr:hypothetical protein [Anaerolineales bacterium]
AGGGGGVVRQPPAAAGRGADGGGGDPDPRRRATVPALPSDNGARTGTVLAKQGSRDARMPPGSPAAPIEEHTTCRNDCNPIQDWAIISSAQALLNNNEC